MDEKRLRYSRHARQRMRKRLLLHEEVDAIVRWPAWRRATHRDTIKHYGYSDDGRLIGVVTDRDERLVLSVIDERRRERRRRQ